MQIIAGTDKFQALDYLVQSVCYERQNDSRKRIFVLVPEHKNLLLEKSLLAKKVGGPLFFTEVLSIKRLAYRLFSETIAFNAKTISRELAALLIYKHVKQTKGTENEQKYAALSPYFYKPEYMRKLLTTEADIRRFQINITDLLTKLATIKTAKSEKLQLKLQALQDLGHAYQMALSEEKLTDEVALIDTLLKFLVQYKKYKKDGANANSSFARLDFLTNSSFYAYGFGEETFISQQEWSLFEQLNDIGSSFHLSIILPNITATYPYAEELRSLLTPHKDEQVSAFTHPNVREIASDCWLKFFQHLPKQASKLYEVGINAYLTLLSRTSFGPLSLTYLAPNYDINQSGVEAKLCQLIQPQAIKTKEDNKQESCQVKRKITIKLLHDKVTLYRQLLQKLQEDCSGENAKYRFGDCAILFANYADDSADFLSVAAEFGLPLYMSEEQVQSPILSSYLHNLWQLLHYGLNRNTVLAFLHSALWTSNLQTIDLNLYENYLISHDLNYGSLLGPFKNFNDFSDAELAENSIDCVDEATAAYISMHILRPLADLQQSLRKAKTRGERLQSLLRYLNNSNLADRVQELFEKLSNSEYALHRQAAFTLQASFGKFIEHYHELLQYSSDLQTENLDEFLSSLELDFNFMQVKIWPSAGSQIWVGAADRVVDMRFKQVYLINFESLTNLSFASNEGVFSREDLELLDKYLLDNFKLVAKQDPESQETLDTNIEQISISFDRDTVLQRRLLNLLYDTLVLPSVQLNVWQVGNDYSLLQKQLKDIPGTEELPQVSISSTPHKAVDYLIANDALLNNLQTTWQNILTNPNNALALQSTTEFWHQLRKNYISAYQLISGGSQVYRKRRYCLSLIHLLNIADKYFKDLQNIAPAISAESNLESANLSLKTSWQLKEELANVNLAYQTESIDISLLKRLLAGNYNFSINQLETYRKNPFAYFCRYLLGLKEPVNKSKSFRNYGVLLHSFAELLVKTFVLASYDLLSKNIDQPNFDILQTAVSKTQKCQLIAESVDLVKLVNIYQQLTVPYCYDHKFAISILEIIAKRQADKLSATEKNNITTILEELKTKQFEKLQLVRGIFQQIEQRDKLDFTNLVYQQAVYPQIVAQATYNLRHILEPYEVDTSMISLPSQLEKRLERCLYDDILAAELNGQTEKLALAEQSKLIGKLDRIDTLLDEKGQANSRNVIDYKSGEAKFDNERLLAGIDLQMPLYAALTSDVPVSNVYYLHLQNLYSSTPSKLVYQQAAELKTNYFALPHSLRELWLDLSLPKEDEALNKFTLDDTSVSRNTELLNVLSDYSFRLSQASLLNILAGNFSYLPLLNKDGSGELPYSTLAKYDINNGTYNYLASEELNLPGIAKSKHLLKQLKQALECWKQNMKGEAKYEQK